MEDSLLGRIPLLNNYVQIHEATDEINTPLEPACKFPRILFDSNGRYPCNKEDRFIDIHKTYPHPSNSPYMIIGHVKGIQDFHIMHQITAAASVRKLNLSRKNIQEEQKKADRKARFDREDKERLEESRKQKRRSRRRRRRSSPMSNKKRGTGAKDSDRRPQRL